MIFQSSMNPKKSRCDFPNGTTQGHDYPSPIILDVNLVLKAKILGTNTDVLIFFPCPTHKHKIGIGKRLINHLDQSIV